jgi:hypothetical protein
VQDCQVCGRSFDPLGFQVVVPELGRGFDRIECAQTARALAGPGSRVAGAPLVAIEPLAAGLVPAAAGSASALRPLGASAAMLGLLGAGTAAAVFLWLRVLGADPSSYTLGRLSAPPAFGHETVQAQVEPARPPTGPAERQAPDSVAAVTVANLVRAPSPTGFAPAPATDDAQKSRPSSSPKLARPANALGAGKAIGKGHRKHGQGHFKHGETDGAHSSGHGQASAHGKGTSKKH